jgi:hypothetical protein
MPARFKYFLVLLICLSAGVAYAQYPNPTNPQYPNPQSPMGGKYGYGADTTHRATKQLTADQEIDTLRKKEERQRDSVIFNSKYIRVTNEALLRDSTQTFPIDTTLTNFENYSPINQPLHPYIGLGNLGLAARPLLFEPPKTIGFDAGLHSLDPYLLLPEDINYYNARVPYTLLQLFTGGGTVENIFRGLHTQNIKPNWNFGFHLNFNGSRGTYSNQNVLGQNVSDVNAAIFTWYQSKNKRYNLLANAYLNTLKAPETGGLASQYSNIFTSTPLDFIPGNAQVKLPYSYEQWKDNGIYVKQFYYIGHIDTVRAGKAITKILPTEQVAYTLHYNVRKYEYLQNGYDTAHVFPNYYYSANRSRDSLSVTHIQNDFVYSFYLRTKAAKTLKNEIKLDLGLTQDLYHYASYVSDSTINQAGAKVTQFATKLNPTTINDITVKGKLSYSLSDKAVLEANVNQIVQGHDFGDFLYEGKLMLSAGDKAGKIILDAYSQNSNPALIYTHWNTNHYIFENDFHNQKISSASFDYVNDVLRVDLKAEYYLVNDYLYFDAVDGNNDAEPTQLTNPINLLKVTLSKKLTWRRWHFDNDVIYQKTDYQSTLRTPQVYTYSSLYFSKLLFNVLNTDIGIDVRYNSTYVAPSYAVGLGEFYNGPNITFPSYPIATPFIKATLYHTNIFVMYDYANQGLFSQGYYTVDRYPMPSHLLKFGVSWAFYN